MIEDLLYFSSLFQNPYQPFLVLDRTLFSPLDDLQNEFVRFVDEDPLKKSCFSHHFNSLLSRSRIKYSINKWFFCIPRNRQWRIQGGCGGGGRTPLWVRFFAFPQQYSSKSLHFCPIRTLLGLIFLIRTPLQKFLDPPLEIGEWRS